MISFSGLTYRNKQEYWLKKDLGAHGPASQKHISAHCAQSASYECDTPDC